MRRGDANQLDLSLGPRRGAIATLLNDAAEQLSESIRRSPYSRYELADRLSYLLGRDIRQATLDAWLAQSNANRMPADVMVCLCRILDSAAPLATMLDGSPWSLADRADRAHAELGRVALAREELDGREAAARRALLNDRGRK